MDLATTPARRRPMEAGMARRLWHVVLAVCHMLRRGFSRKRVMMDVNLLLGRGKVAGRALRGHLAASSASSLASFYGHPREVEFSCTTTPSYPPLYGLLFPFGGSSKGRRGGCGLDAAAVARAFEMLSTAAEADGNGAAAPSPMATPSPMVAWILGRSPAGARPLRVTDSPFPAVPEDDACGSQRVDAEADEFIRKFYEQLRMQPYAATPDAQLHRHG